MMINECGHPLCKNCVENLFARNSGNCHVCSRLLKKNGYREQIFDDPLIDKETAIRRRLRKIYNLKRDDFPTLREFNDYQEREKNKDTIERNKRRLDEDQKWIEDNLRDERAMKNRINEVLAQESKENENTAVTDTKAIMEELRESNVAAEIILDRERKRQIEKELEEKEEQEKRKRIHKELLQDRKRHAESMSFTSTMRVAGRPYTHQPLDLVINGPTLPSMKDIETMGYLTHMKAASAGRVAGGYTSSLGCMRAIFESRVDLLAF
ncbi:unnamed protein product [Caenorhabditis auriculariae]|uniref:RING-type domain-containing protein n=1 Tax=Caenorhabditis auriculariae TaxID=2777116 RepID=A0A8S1HL91_9PELO|nr:unnamed protein product [Caenorhabditis auriculariae]